MKLHLGVKVNLLVVGVLSTLLIVILILLQTGMADATARIGRTSMAQEIAVIQRQLDRAEQDAVASARLLAVSPQLLASVQIQDAARARTAVLLDARDYGFDSAVVADQNGNRLVTTRESSGDEITQEDKLLARALLNINAIGVLTERNGATLSLAVALPLTTGGDKPIGALLVGRTLDARFLDQLNLSRDNIHLLLLRQNKIVADTAAADAQHQQGLSEADQTALLSYSGEIAQALGGQEAIGSELVSVNGEPHELAMLPLTVQGVTVGVLGIMHDAGDLIATQNQLTINLTMAFTVLAIMAIGLMALFIRRFVTGPLQALQHAANHMAQGDYEQRATVATQDELGQLAVAMNVTALAVQEREASLQVAKQALEQQTEDLEKSVVELRQLIDERDQLTQSIRDLSSPVLPMFDGILVMPLIGVIDSERAALLTQSLLGAVERHRAHMVILDVTGVPIIDTQVAQTLLQAAEAARLLGAKTVLVGLRPELAQTIVGLGLHLSDLVTRADLQSGVLYALQRHRGAELQLGGR